MKAPFSRLRRSIRVLSPRIEPPDRAEDGSTASTATRSPFDQHHAEGLDEGGLAHARRPRHPDPERLPSRRDGAPPAAPWPPPGDPHACFPRASRPGPAPCDPRRGFGLQACLVRSWNLRLRRIGSRPGTPARPVFDRNATCLSSPAAMPCRAVMLLLVLLSALPGPGQAEQSEHDLAFSVLFGGLAVAEITGSARETDAAYAAAVQIRSTGPRGGLRPDPLRHAGGGFPGRRPLSPFRYRDAVDTGQRRGRVELHLARGRGAGPAVRAARRGARRAPSVPRQRPAARRIG
jgi:hypothetical protein